MLFTHYSSVTLTYLFSNLPHFIEAEWSIYLNVQYVIRSKNYVLNLFNDSQISFAQVQWNYTIHLIIAPIGKKQVMREKLVTE